MTFKVEDFERSFNLLNENVIYGQQLSQTGSWTHDIQNDLIYLSDEVYHILECSPREFGGNLDKYYQYIHPDDLKEVMEATQGAIKGKEYNIEYRVIASNGTEKYVRERTKALYDENRNPVKMIGIIQDITERKILENSLKALDHDLNQAQRVAGVGSWKYDSIKNEVFWSEEIFRIYGINPKNFDGNLNKTLKLIHPDDFDNLQNAIDKCLTGKAYELEYRIPQFNSSEKYVVTKGEPIFNNKGQIVGILGTIQDITQKKIMEQKLKNSFKILEQAQDLAQFGSWELDLANNKNYWSNIIYKIFGITHEQYDNTYEGFLEFVYPNDKVIIEKYMKNPPKEPFDLEFRIIKSDNSVRNVHQRVEFIFDKDGIPIYAYGTIQDVTENKKLLKEVEYKQEEVNTIQKIFQVLVHESSDVFEIITPDGTIKYISEAVEKVTGHKPRERIGKKVYDFYTGAELRKLKVMVESVLYDSEKKVKGEVILKNKSGKDICLEVEMQNLLHEPVIEGIVVNFRDITSRINMQKQINYISTHDELTGLPNQAYFKKQLNYQFQLAKDTKTEFGLIMLYFSELNYINYSLGYETGQKLFIEICKRLEMLLCKDTFLCRYSEDHISIITQDLGTHGKYEKFVEELISLSLLPYKVEKYELDISINIGICIYTGIEQDMDSLINHSLVALHRSRKEGKNKCKFYTSNLDIQDYKEFQLKNDLRSAPNNGQLIIYYQPVVNIKTNEILSAEALIRWNHPDWGLMSPDEFISLAEETGLIIDVGNWVLREVCKNYKKWLNEGFAKIKVSVNFSSMQFLQNEFVENIINTINEFELDPHFLIMEITESAIMENANKAISDIRRLQSVGIQVALDDFGTGFSSLAYLSVFNIDILKLDALFVKRVNIDNTTTAILKNIINLTTDLKIMSVVEGIETWEQLSYLKDLNCNAGQGFIYCKPIPLGDFEKVLAKIICEPLVVNYTQVANREDRRKLFRVELPKKLEAYMTILEVKGKRVAVGNSKVSIKNIGPGGLCFISNIKLNVERDFILQFTTQLLGKEIKICGWPVWTKKTDENLFEYGIQFTFDENKSTLLTQILNQAQLKWAP